MEPFPVIILCLILFYCTLDTATPDNSNPSSSSEAVQSATQSGTATPDNSNPSSSSEAVQSATQSGTATPDNSTLSSTSEKVHSTAQSGTATPDNSTLSSSSEKVHLTAQSGTATPDNSNTSSSSEAVRSTTQSDKVKGSTTPTVTTIVTSSKVTSNSSNPAKPGDESKAVENANDTYNQNHDSSSKMIWLPVIVISVFVIAAIAAILKTKCKPQTVNGEDADGDIMASKPSGHDVKLVSVKRTSRDFDFLLPEYYLGSENGKFEDAIMNLENTQIV